MPTACTSYGRYRIKRLLGEGGMGKVYLADDPLLDRQVAVKVISLGGNLDTSTRTEYLHRFSVEARASAKLSHQSIVTVYDAGEQDGVPWIAFEYVDGERLDLLVQREGRLPLQRVITIGCDIAGALAVAHRRHIVHRDIKPTNILLDSADGIAKIADFGIVKTPWAGVTQEGSTVGSPGYMSPEQIEGREVDHRSDLFSLGVVLYEMAAGAHPFVRETVASTVFATVGGAYTPLREAVPGCPPALDSLVSRCLQAGKEQRIQSASELLGELRAVRAETSAQSAPQSKRPEPSEPHHRPQARFVDQARSLGGFLRRWLHRAGTEMVAFAVELGRPSPPSSMQSVTRPVAGTRYARYLKSGMGTIGECLMKQARKWSRMVHQLWRGNPSVLARTASLGAAVAVVLLVAILIVRIMVLSSRVHNAPVEEAIVASRKLQKLGLTNHESELLARGRRLIERDSLDAAATIAGQLSDRTRAELPAKVLLARIALKRGDHDRALDLVREASSHDGWKGELRKIRGVLFGDLEGVLTDGEASEKLIELVVGPLKAARSRVVKRWVEDKHYWLRWNAVAIREKAGLPVDMVEVYILDLKHGGSVRTRRRAALELGEIGDKRAIPALEQARDRGWRDPFVSATANSVLEESF